MPICKYPIEDKPKRVSKLYKWFAKKLMCSKIFGSGHILEPFLYEDKYYIYSRRCKRCNSIMGGGYFKGWAKRYKAQTLKGRIDWINYCHKRDEEYRIKVRNEIELNKLAVNKY
jgi:hypothetical protein